MLGYQAASVRSVPQPGAVSLMTAATTVWRSVGVVQNFSPTSSPTDGAKSPVLVRKTLRGLHAGNFAGPGREFILSLRSSQLNRK